MAVTNFIPDIWSARILTNLSRSAVALGVCNTDYQGDASGGSVKITAITDPTIRTYTGADITVEDIDDASQQLLLNQKKYFAFYLDDVERAQAVDGGAILSEASNRAAYGLANSMDQYILDVMVSGASASNPDHVIEEFTITKAEGAYNTLVDLSVKLDESDVPPEQRWAVVTPAFYGLLLKDERFISAGDDAAAATRSNGRVGVAAGLEVYRSNNLPGAASGTDTNNKLIVVGSRYATTVAQQVNSVEAMRHPDKFADQVRGLHVYGVKVLRDESLVTADVRIALS